MPQCPSASVCYEMPQQCALPVWHFLSPAPCPLDNCHKSLLQFCHLCGSIWTEFCAQDLNLCLLLLALGNCRSPPCTWSINIHRHCIISQWIVGQRRCHGKTAMNTQLNIKVVLSKTFQNKLRPLQINPSLIQKKKPLQLHCKTYLSIYHI